METKTQLYEKKQSAYRRRMTFFRENPSLTKTLHIINLILTYTVFLLYPLLLVWLWLNHGEFLYRAVAVPLDAFIILSVIRFFINRKRPYEAYGIPPAVHKSTVGKSFPSRHVFSAFLIAVTFLYVGPDPLVGCILLLVGALLGALRVLLGVHYASDVIVGAAAGIVGAFAGYSLFF